MRRRTNLQAALALLMAAALMAPALTALDCGEACCASAAVEHAHHPHADVMAPADAPVGCPMSGACVLTPPAAVPPEPTVVHLASHGAEPPLPFAVAFRSFVTAPEAPPPRA